VYFVILFNLCLSFYNYLILFLGFRFWVRSSRSSVRLRALLTEDVVDLDVVWDVVAVVDVVVTWRDVTWCRLSMFEIRSSFARPCLKTLHSVFSLRSLRGKKCFFLLLFWCAPFCDAQLVWVRGSLFLSFCLYVFSLGENVLLWERERLCIDFLSSFSFCLFVLFSLLPLGCERLLLLDDYSPFSRLKGWMKSDLGVSTCC
jgi:hypothetical protein